MVLLNHMWSSSYGYQGTSQFKHLKSEEVQMAPSVEHPDVTTMGQTVSVNGQCVMITPNVPMNTDHSQESEISILKQYA
jgi:hypothetical protein